MSHPPVEILIQHAFGLTANAEAAHIAECRSCTGEVDELSSMTLASTRTPIEFPKNLEALESRLDVEQSQARELLERLDDEDLIEAAREEPTLRTAGGLQVLLEMIPIYRRRNPGLALQIARSAAFVVDVVNPKSLRDDLHVDLLREIATSARVLGDYDEARRGYDQAELEAQKLSVADFALGRIWYERAGLEISHEGANAREWATRAADVFRRFGDDRRYNRSHYLIAVASYNERDYQTTISALRGLLPRLESDGDEETLVMAWNMLGQALSRENQLDGAEHAFRQALSKHAHLDHPSEMLRAEWGLAQTALRRGQVDRSLEILNATRSRFKSMGLLEESGLVGLDMAEGFLLKGHDDRALEICRESMHLLREHFGGREQQRALAYLGEIANTMDSRRVRHVTDYLSASRQNPDLVFVQPLDR